MSFLTKDKMRTVPTTLPRKDIIEV